MIRILVDPGHAWNGNPYPTQKGYYEGTQMWRLAQFLQPELEKRGFYVKNTRPNLRDFHDVADRGKMAKGFDLVVSLHSNALAPRSDGSHEKTTGTVIFRTISTPEIKALGDDMGNRISKLMGHHYRGTQVWESASRKGEDRNSVLRNAIRVGCKAGLLVEHGFHTNVRDAAFLVVDENLKKLAVAEAEAISNFYGNGKKEGELMLTRTLRHGDSGEDVKLVQEFLKARGYYTGPIDGKFGPGKGFLNAVIAFQKAENLENPNGNIGPITRARIIEMMLEVPKPVDDPQVKELQAKVASLEVELARVQNLAREIIG
ncbi:MAG: hypothetical protein GX783_05270 [Clostridiales bacterium]|nr:hypothetical protein [Clostridiales bacterium]